MTATRTVNRIRRVQARFAALNERFGTRTLFDVTNSDGDRQVIAIHAHWMWDLPSDASVNVTVHSYMPTTFQTGPILVEDRMWIPSVGRFAHGCSLNASVRDFDTLWEARLNGDPVPLVAVERALDTLEQAVAFCDRDSARRLHAMTELVPAVLTNPDAPMAQFAIACDLVRQIMLERNVSVAGTLAKIRDRSAALAWVSDLPSDQDAAAMFDIRSALMGVTRATRRTWVADWACDAEVALRRRDTDLFAVVCEQPRYERIGAVLCPA